MTAFEATFFDMDGVTVATAHAWRHIEETKILPAATADTPTENPIRALSVGDAYDRLAATAKVAVDREGFAALYDEHATAVYRERATLLPGYHDLLETLSAQGRAVGLVSASKRAWVEMVLDRFALDDAFDTVVSADDVGRSKPAPESYERAAAAVGVDPADAIAVEDSPHGIESATRAGLYCIALRGDGNGDLDLSAADAVAASPTELHRRLHALASETER